MTHPRVHRCVHSLYIPRVRVVRVCVCARVSAESAECRDRPVAPQSTPACRLPLSSTPAHFPDAVALNYLITIQASAIMSKTILCVCGICLFATLSLAAGQGAAAPEAITLNVEGVGTATCQPNDDPVRVVTNFARQAAAAGFDQIRSDDAFNRMLQYFCQRRQCTTAIPQRVSVNVEGVGSLSCPVWVEPAACVEDFAAQAIDNQVDFGIPQMQQILQYFCARTMCLTDQLEQPQPRLTLNVDGVGRLTVASARDPADAVEEFAGKAIAAGVDFGADAMKQMMEYFCVRRKCKRLQLRMPAPPAQ